MNSMINKMPGYAQAPIKTYLETGNFKGQTPEPMSAAEADEMLTEMKGLTDAVVLQDNTQADSNPEVGIIESDGFFGREIIEFEDTADGSHGYGKIGDEEDGAAAYVRENDELFEIIIASSSEGSDDGVMHINKVDKSKSFMTMDPTQMGMISK